jgi:DNA invertase Pin-like site-specific DNA recombinase
MISTRGSGERLDREELDTLREAISRNDVDLVLTEDIGRICRRLDSLKICEHCQDHNTRLIAINDYLDTSSESWKILGIMAAARHEQYNEDTSRRIKRSLSNRFTQGGIIQTLIACYEKPEGAKNLSEIRKFPEWEPIVEGIFDRLENDWSYSEVADWLNEQSVPTGRWCTMKTWDCAKVIRVVHCTMLKGIRTRNKKVSKRDNKTGRRKPVNAPPKDWLEYPCPHLAFVSAERYDRLIAKLKEKNACYRAGKKNGIDNRLGRSKKRTVWPGQHVTCGVCGRNYVYGGNGLIRHLACRGSKEYKCWNSISFDAELASHKIGSAVYEQIATMPDFADVYAACVRDELNQRGDSREDRIAAVRKALAEKNRHIGNIVKSIEDTGGTPALCDRLKLLEEERKQITRQLEDIEQESQDFQSLPSFEELRDLALKSFQDLPRESHEFAKIMKQLIPTIVVYPHRALDGGHVVLRAKFNLSLVPLLPVLRKLTLDLSVLMRELTVDLFEVPQRIEFRERIVAMIGQGVQQRETAKELGITQPAVQRALKLDALMNQSGTADPFIPIFEPPEDYGRLRRHKHKRFKFEPLPPPND